MHTTQSSFSLPCEHRFLISLSHPQYARIAIPRRSAHPRALYNCASDNGECRLSMLVVISNVLHPLRVEKFLDLPFARAAASVAPRSLGRRSVRVGVGYARHIWLQIHVRFLSQKAGRVGEVRQRWRHGAFIDEIEICESPFEEGVETWSWPGRVRG